eukprot:Skav217626  [mRNA]  locus=scaffold2172:789307:792972:+ [translate_table: standard]
MDEKALNPLGDEAPSDRNHEGGTKGASQPCPVPLTSQQLGEEEFSLRSTGPTPREADVVLPGGVAGATAPVIHHPGQPANSPWSPCGPSQKSFAPSGIDGLMLGSCGTHVLQLALEVLPLRSKNTDNGGSSSVFPLPTSRTVIAMHVDVQSDDELAWCLCVCLGLNSLWGGYLFYDGEASELQKTYLKNIYREVKRLCGMEAIVPRTCWDELFRVRSIDYKGDEVRVARHFTWDNIEPALPKEVGCVPLVEVCTLGSRHYVQHFPEFLKPEAEWGPIPRPRVMVPDDAWAQVCRGLLESRVCVMLSEEEVFQTGSGPLLNGLFGVTKDEWTDTGTEIFRLIMNLVPLNSICQPMKGDVDTLPSWGSMNPFFLQPDENLLISSEDVKCFFYTMSVPDAWIPFLAFNKEVPLELVPHTLTGKRCYLASRVLPMGFLNSVSLAQHVHRNLVAWGGSKAAEDGEQVLEPSSELRKDRPFPLANPSWRVYLDNFDLLEKVQSTQMVDYEGTVSPGIWALRSEYEVWRVPRNLKKAVSRSAKCELQGATVDGVEGVAYPRESKLSKYVGLAYSLARLDKATQKQWQVVCGGLVYFTMFRRSLLSGLNNIWKHVESYNVSRRKVMSTPDDCKLELCRQIALVALARIDFRLDMHPMVTCSDASTTGGGFCASMGLTHLGGVAASGGLRGELRECRDGQMVLSVGLFDGIGALRVALEALQVSVLAHISVEVQETAQRVVESHYPGTIKVSDVRDIDVTMVRQWAAAFSQCSLVVIGAGPPCQGLSGLNCDRKGALRDCRSNLFVHVPRVRRLFQQEFSWCQVHAIMESVASMDSTDRNIMSQEFGDEPVRCDAGEVLWCHRPRLYWITWPVEDGYGYTCDTSGEVAVLHLEGGLPLAEMVHAGWLKVDPQQPFPTFTTSRPRAHPGRKPAGLKTCTQSELQRWEADEYRFPPYQYKLCHSLVNSKNELRLPTVQEREVMLGFPPQYTAACMAKGQRSSASYNDTRLSLVGNSWAVPVVACLLAPLFWTLQWFPPMHTQEVLDRFRAMRDGLIQGRLTRLPLNPRRALSSVQPYKLAFRLGNLISIKGEDILLTSSGSQMVKHHRLRASVPARLWRWRIISGWQWRFAGEHINALEMKAVVTSLRWRLEKQLHGNCRVIHLTDSLVCLHALSRGRSSSRKLRRSIARLSALSMAANVQAVWAYVHTEQNPADKPSRWGRRVRTKYRNAA